jgi:hypothetical protein
MKLVRLSLVLLILVALSAQLAASGQVSIYAIIEKVVLEPNDREPERIQIWGAFTLSEQREDRTLTPRRGYMYFVLPQIPGWESARAASLKEWADLKAIAGTGQAVAFGQIGYIGAFSDELISRPAGMPPYLLVPGAHGGNMLGSKNVLRPESAVPPTAPDVYQTNFGLVKLPNNGNMAPVIEKLKAALKR